MTRGTANNWRRASAILVLPTWVAALVVCSAECLWNQCHSPLDNSHNHSDSYSTTARCHGDGNDGDHTPPKTPDEHGFCSSLGAMLLSSYQDAILKPQFALAWLLISPPSSQNLSTESTAVLEIRQAQRRNWVFTPEVYLGLAVRSLPPPLHS